VRLLLTQIKVRIILNHHGLSTSQTQVSHRVYGNIIISVVHPDLHHNGVSAPQRDQRSPRTTKRDTTSREFTHSNNSRRRSSGVQRRRCWVCDKPGCHSDRHANQPNLSAPTPSTRSCWICGQPGCHSNFHTQNESAIEDTSQTLVKLVVHHRETN